MKRIVLVVTGCLLSGTAYADGVSMESSGDTIYVRNETERAVQCQLDYDVPNGVGGMMGERRAVYVSAGDRKAAVSGVIWNASLWGCKWAD